jgi:hypothetical protein
MVDRARGVFWGGMLGKQGLRYVFVLNSVFGGERGVVVLRKKEVNQLVFLVEILICRVCLLVSGM